MGKAASFVARKKSFDVPGRAVTAVARSEILFYIYPPVHDKIKKG